MFSLPYAALRAGFSLTVFYLIVLGLLLSITHLAYAEVTLRTSAPHRFTGYVGRYLGERWKKITFIEGLIGLWGSLLIYTIVAAKFGNLVLSPLFASAGLPVSETVIGAFFFLIAALIIWGGDVRVGRQELAFTIPMVMIIFVIFLVSVYSPEFSSSFLTGWNKEEWLLPYGIVLFALSGFSAVPMLEHILSPAREKGLTFNYPFIVFAGTFIPVLLYILFTWGVVGVSGTYTSEDALSGLSGIVWDGIIAAGAILALFAIYTSFISIGNELEKTFSEDYHISKRASFFLTLAAPFLLYLLEVRDFITIIEFIGALMGGYIGIVTILLLWKAQKEGDSTSPFSLKIPKPLGFFIMALFFVASLYAFYDIISPFLFSSLRDADITI